MNREGISDWGERLDAGVTNGQTLELARELETRRPVPVRPSPEFVAKLRNELLAPPEGRFRRSPAWLLVGLAIVAVSIGVAVAISPAAPASAAEVFERANQHYAGLAQGDGVLHTVFTLAYTELDIIDQSVIRRYVWDGELWQDLNGPDFRQQLLDEEGTIHYFAQRRGDIFWRSAYPVVASRGDLVYRMTEAEFYAAVAGFTYPIAPIFGSIIDWLDLDSRWIADRTDCENPFCAIGLEDGVAWSCADDRCTLPLGSLGSEHPESTFEVSLVGSERLPDGRAVDVVEMRVSFEDRLVRRLKFDSDTHELVEVVAYQMGAEMARMTFVGREILSGSPAVVFGALPGQLREVKWASEDAPPKPRIAAAGFPGAPSGVPRGSAMLPVFALPSEGSTLASGSELQVFLEINAPLSEEVELTAELCGTPPPGPPTPFDPSSSCGGLASATVTVEKGKASTRIDIPIESDDSWPDKVWVYFRWVYSNGDFGGTLDPDYFWFVDQ